MGPGRVYISFYKPTKAKGAFGSMEETARELVRTIKAERMSTRISEKLALGENEVGRVVFKVRYYANIMDTALEIDFESKQYNIIDIDEICRHRWLLITAKA